MLQTLFNYEYPLGGWKSQHCHVAIVMGEGSASADARGFLPSFPVGWGR